MIELRDDERKLAPESEPTAERLRKSVEDETGRLLPRFFRKAERANTRGATGSGPVTKAIDGADTGRWLNEVVARHRASVEGRSVQAPGSLRVENISEARARLREVLGREPNDQELEALAVMIGAFHRRKLGDESATVPPGSPVRKDVAAVSEAEVSELAPTPGDFREGPLPVDRSTGTARCPRCGGALAEGKAASTLAKALRVRKS